MRSKCLSERVSIYVDVNKRAANMSEFIGL